MKTLYVALAAILYAQTALALDPATLSGKSMKCGPITLKFGPGGETASINGATPTEVQWGNRGQDAVIGDLDFEPKGSGKFELDGAPCR